MKNYELIIDQARDDEITWIRAKGFWTEEQMIQTAYDQNWYEADTDRKFMNLQQGYYKTVPTRDGCLYVACDKSVRGSYPCTYLEVW